jgi:NAD(P)-dependent dehydrogenase (short-subunit alcohol dehydrogenase family)
MPTVLVTGASRGIGLEFARQYAADGWKVIATARGPVPQLEALGVRVETLDMRDFAAVEGFSDGLAGTPLDVLVANAGISAGPRIDSAAEAEAALETLAVNAVAPTLLARRLLPNLANGRIAAITSRMGSIADSSGGYLGYRASKAALNAAWYALSREVRVPLVLLHPGWVQTDMGGASAPVAPAESVAGMRRVIAGLTAQNSGSFLDYRGQPIPW